MLLNAMAGLGSGFGPAIVAILLSDGFGATYMVGFIFLTFSLISHMLATMIIYKRSPKV